MALPKAIAADKIAAVSLACAGLLMISLLPAAAGSNGTDRFGVKEIYQTKPGGLEWYFNATAPDGGLSISPAAVSLESGQDGTWKTGRLTSESETGMRMYVISDAWQDVEMTGYVKLGSYSFEEEFAWAVRSGQHTDRDPCEGTAYYGALSFAGRASFQKEVAHVEGGYADKRFSSLTVDPLKGRWVGIKVIAYNVGEDVKLEMWVDDRADGNWTKIAETTDSGGWSSRETACGREHDHVISESRPRVTFRVDNAIFEFKNLSVREIVPQPPEPHCYFGAFRICL